MYKFRSLLKVFPGNISRNFATTASKKVGTYKITAEGQPPGGVNWISGKTGEEKKMEHELEALLGALAGCESATASFHAKKSGINFQGISYKIEADYDFRAHLEGEKVPNRFTQVRVEAEVLTDGSQEDVDKLDELVKTFCPIYNMIKLSGVDIQTKWIKKVATKKD